jgi:Fic family protein
LLLLRAGYAYVPYSSLESVIELSKEQYYLALRRTQGTIRTAAPAWAPWLGFFLHALQQQKRNLERKIEREQIILGNLPELSVQILEYAREHGRVTIAEAVKITGQSRGTIRDHTKALTNGGHLVLHGAGRGAWYGLT